MIMILSDPVNGLETWKRFLEEWDRVNRGRHRAMLMQFAAMSFHGKQRSSLGGVGTSCTAVRGGEFGHNQSSNTGTQLHRIQSGADMSD